MPTLAEVLRQTGYSQDGTLVAPATDSPMTKALSEHIKTLPQQLATNQAALDSAIASWNKTDFATGKPNPNYRPEAIAELTQLMPNIGGLTAWHGTPHKIQGAFDISKVGTGEGAQAYGHGMYFAENPVVAEGYKNALSNPEVVLQNGKRITSPTTGTPEDVAKAWLEEAFLNKIDNPIDYSIQKLIKLKNAANNPKQFEQAVNVLEDWKKQGATVDLGGNLYKVDIPDEYIPNMLDWNKPLIQQPKSVQQALAKIDPDSYSSKGMDYDPTELGQAIYHRLMNSPLAKNDVEASALLNKSGISGIRYLDEGSRNVPKPDIEYYAKGVEKLKELYKKQPTEANKFALDDAMQKLESVKRSQKDITSNFVVFDPSTVKILEENGKPLTRKELIEKQVKELKD